MAQPVWVLSVDLQTKTATFQSGMAEAAKSARGAFNDIKQGSGEMGREVGYSMTEARHGVMFLAEGFDTHLPRALATFIAALGPIGAATEAAFPFLAIAIGAKLLIEHLSKIHEEAEKLEQAEGKFETATHNAFNALHGILLQAEIQADELNRDHLGALKHQLELIDQQSLEELVHSFDIVAKAADAVFAELKSHWYTQGIGADGAKHALERFQTQYESLIAQGKTKEASDLLAGTLASAEKILHFQKEYIGNQMNADNGKGGDGRANPDYNKFEEAALALKEAGVGATEKEVKAQETLVHALHAQVDVEKTVADLKKTQKDNATHRTNNEINNDAFRALKQQFDADKAAQDQEDRDRDEARNRAIARHETEEREKIAATKQGSRERLQAIEDALHEEEKYGLQETAFYHSLGVQKVETIRQMAEEEARIKAEAGRESAAHAQKMGELEIAAEQEAAKLRNAGRRVTRQELIEQDIHFADEESALQLQAINKQIATLDKSDKDYENKLRALYNKQEELERAHQNKITQIKDRATIERNARILSAEHKLEEEIARGLSSVIMRHETFAAMLVNIGDQIGSAMIQNAIKDMFARDMTREKDAAAAARDAFVWGWHNGGPAAPVLAPTLAAGAFAAVMAFADGGIVPGVGRGDTVPAVLTPGEHVADKELTDGLRGMVRSGAGAHKATHVHVHNTYHVSALDGGGMEEVLARHNDTVTRHIERTVRRMNQ
jgi:hypothetical protein